MLNLLFWRKIHLENVFASYCSEKHEILSALNTHGSNCVRTTVFSQEGNYSVLKDPIIKLRKRVKNRFYEYIVYMLVWFREVAKKIHISAWNLSLCLLKSKEILVSPVKIRTWDLKTITFFASWSHTNISRPFLTKRGSSSSSPDLKVWSSVASFEGKQITPAG